MTVLALPESTPELFARRSTLHISSSPVVSPPMLWWYHHQCFGSSHGCFSCSHQLPCCLIETPYLESVSKRDPPILSTLILHSLTDLVAAAQLSFPVVCIDVSLLYNCSAHVTEMLLCCSAFAILDQKSPVASYHFHSSISSISPTKKSHKSLV